MLKGSCNCGAVQFTVSGAPKGPSVCHCGQCRKQSGHLWASAYVAYDALVITQDRGLKWYVSSASAKRGFCANCGAFLFWKMTAETTTSFSLGSIDGPSGITLEKHIFVADKGDYYEIADDLPQQRN